jgi:hypothetical protein
MKTDFIMYDIECPYCGFEQNIDHEDCYGYCEGELYEQECSECGKTFGYETMISYSYTVKKLPCSNGEDHCLEEYKIIPPEFGVGKKMCKWCGEVITVDEKANKEAMDSYFDGLKDCINKGFDNFDNC